MKKSLIISTLLLTLAACQKTDTPANPAPTSDAPVAASSPVTQTSIRANYQQQCVISALNGQATASAAAHEAAYKVCDCVYEEGIKAYGSQAEWEKYVTQFDKNQTDDKLKQVSEKALEVCLTRHHGNHATASAPN